MIWLRLSIVLLAAIASSFGVSFLSSAWRKRKRLEPETLRIDAALPGYNCGLCGLPDCRSYAAAIDREGTDPALCSPGGSRLESRLRSFLEGRQADARGLSRSAVVRCGGCEGAATADFSYDGRRDCRSVMEKGGGPKLCKEGCVGYGSCAAACPLGAISVQFSLAVVDPAICSGCGECVKACPRDIIALVPRDQAWYVACSSRSEPAAKSAECAVACTACGECARLAEDSEFFIVGNLAKENPESTGNRWAEIAERCPTGAIVLAGSEKKHPSPFRTKAR